LSTYEARFFHIRSRQGFDETLRAAIAKGYESWLEWVASTLQTWGDVPHRANLPKPDYQITPPMLSNDGRTLTIRVEGDPGTHGAMMLIEDPALEMLIAYVPEYRLGEIEVAYENEDLKAFGQPSLTWRQVGR
jgi:hypothetical protein